MKTFAINEIFLSLQGEGGRAGTANVFVRFAGCNLRCAADSPEENGQFDCDTEFSGGRKFTVADLLAEVERSSGACRWVILTGGEPLLQVDTNLLAALHDAGYQIAVETNGTQPLPVGLDWVCVSPKTAEHTLKVYEADEVKYVRHAGQALPKPTIKAAHYFLSPAWDAHGLNRDNLAWCIELVKENPQWKLSLQQHKWWKIR